jgi:hypothetical protein
MTLLGVAVSVINLTDRIGRLNRQLRLFARFNEELEAVVTVFQSIEIVLRISAGDDLRAMVDEMNELGREFNTILADQVQRLKNPIWKFPMDVIRYPARQKQNRGIMARLVNLAFRLETHLL